MTVSESKIEFVFDAKYSNQVLKYDDSAYYKDMFEKQPGAKAVDFIAVSPKRYVMIEVKNCVGDEAGNRWRITPDNRKVQTASPADRDVSNRESLDIEVARKTAMTIAGMVGVFSNPTPKAKCSTCAPYAEALCHAAIHTEERKIVVILVFDGDFGCATRNDKMIRRELRQKLQQKLQWLNAVVLVTDSEHLCEARIGISAKRTAV